MKRRRAFTLLELLIASAIFAVVVVSVYASFTSGLFGYRRIDEATEANQAARQAFEIIDRDLRNAFLYKAGATPKESRFSGTQNGLSFLTLVNNYRAKAVIADYAFVSYELNAGKLTRLCRRNKDSLNQESLLEPEELVSNVEDFSVEYLYDLNQPSKAAWDEPERLPIALKVELKLKYKFSGSYAFSRTIFLPMGEPQPQNE